MIWIDVVALLMIVTIAWLESVRGFGHALFDLVGALIALRVAIFLSAPLADAAPVMQPPAQAEAFWLATIFLILIALTIIATKFIYDSTLLSLDVLDPVVGALCGLASGIMVAHILLRMVHVAYADTEFAQVLMDGFMAKELLEFRSYHAFVTALQNLGNW